MKLRVTKDGFVIGEPAGCSANKKNNEIDLTTGLYKNGLDTSQTYRTIGEQNDKTIKFLLGNVNCKVTKDGFLIINKNEEYFIDVPYNAIFYCGDSIIDKNKVAYYSTNKDLSREIFDDDIDYYYYLSAEKIILNNKINLQLVKIDNYFYNGKCPNQYYRYISDKLYSLIDKVFSYYEKIGFFQNLLSKVLIIRYSSNTGYKYLLTQSYHWNVERVIPHSIAMLKEIKE